MAGITLYLVLGTALIATGWVGSASVRMVVEAHAWALTAAIPLATAYVYRQALSDRVLTMRVTGTAVLLWIGFAIGYVWILQGTGFFGAGVRPSFAALTLSTSLLPLLAVALAPWAFSLIRHR